MSDDRFIGRDYGDNRVGFTCEGPSMTKQSFAEATDINAIMRKYLTTGMMDHFNRGEPRYGDFSSGDDYRTMIHRVMQAQDAFDNLPAEVRDYCDNDPAKLLDMVYDPSRIEEVRKLGLIPPGEPAPAAPVGVAPTSE